MPRVIAGSARGIPLMTPRGSSTRPTGDKVEALFSILTPVCPRRTFLICLPEPDEIGLEAASRDAGQVVLIESAPQCLQAIRENIIKTRLADKVALMSADVFGLCINSATTVGSSTSFFGPTLQSRLCDT